jgi:hypothetical protein
MLTILKFFLVLIVVFFILGILKSIGEKLIEGLGKLIGVIVGSPIFWIFAVVLAIIWIFF